MLQRANKYTQPWPLKVYQVRSNRGGRFRSVAVPKRPNATSVWSCRRSPSAHPANTHVPYGTPKNNIYNIYTARLILASNSALVNICNFRPLCALMDINFIFFSRRFSVGRRGYPASDFLYLVRTKDLRLHPPSSKGPNPYVMVYDY